ncbi:MAG TPA: hypothetical protein VNG12_05380 [Acidimicrobiales bacterium]|nr:hypothetical protein [Acidimicrobiales bacterium]
MTFLLLSVPLMLVFVMIAAVPLLVLSVREHRLVQADAISARWAELEPNG